jgi:hypothetical protein
VLVLSLLISSLCVLPALLTVWPAEEGRTR